MREAERNIASAGRASLVPRSLVDETDDSGDARKGGTIRISHTCSNSKAQLVVCGRQYGPYETTTTTVTATSKSSGFSWQNNNFARASGFFVHFLAVPARLRREMTKF